MMLGFYVYIVACLIYLRGPFYRFYNNLDFSLRSVDFLLDEEDDFMRKAPTKLIRFPSESSCDAVKEEIFNQNFTSVSQYLKSKSAELSAEALIKIYDCGFLMEESFETVATAFQQWKALKRINQELYNQLMKTVNIEECSMAVLKTIPSKDLIDKMKSFEGIWSESLLNRLPMSEILNQALMIDGDFEFWKRISLREFLCLQPQDRLKMFLVPSKWKTLNFADQLRFSIRTEDFFFAFLEKIGEVAFPNEIGFYELMDICKNAVENFIESVKIIDKAAKSVDKVTFISHKMRQFILRIEASDAKSNDEIFDRIEDLGLRALMTANLLFRKEIGFNYGAGNACENDLSQELVDAFTAKKPIEDFKAVLESIGDDGFVKLETLRVYHSGTIDEKFTLFESIHSSNYSNPIYTENDLHCITDWIKIIGHHSKSTSNNHIPVHVALFNSVFKRYGHLLHKDHHHHINLRSIIQNDLKPLLNDPESFFKWCRSDEVKIELLLAAQPFGAPKTLEIEFFDYRTAEERVLRQTLAKVFKFYEDNQTMRMTVEYSGMRGQDSGGLARHLLANVLMALIDERLGLFQMTKSGALIPRALLDPDLLGWVGAMHAQALILGIKVPWTLDLDFQNHSTSIKLKDIVQDLSQSLRIFGKAAEYPKIEDIEAFALQFRGSSSKLFFERFDLSELPVEPLKNIKKSDYFSQLDALEANNWKAGVENYRKNLSAGLDKKMVGMDGVFEFLSQVLKPVDASTIAWNDFLNCFKFSGSAGNRASAAFTLVLQSDPIINIPLLLEFVYGSPNLPPGGLDSFHVTVEAIFVQELRDAKFPHVSTCARQVTWNVGILESEQDLMIRLLQAINNSQNFDYS